MNKKKRYAIVDLFCGVGGLSHGFVLEKGFDIVAGIDSDPSCKFAFSANNGAEYLCQDLSQFDPKEINALFPRNSIKILVGCAPCQPFSRYTSGVKPQRPDDKWSLLNAFARIIEETEPAIISMENVPQLARYNKNSVYSDFIDTLSGNGYFVSDTHKVVHCPAYGVPQNRKRLVLLASKFGPINLIPPSFGKDAYPTVRKAIGSLPKIEDGQMCSIDPLHRAQKLSALNKKRIRVTREGGSWRDWPDELWLDCHRKLIGKKFGDVYGRMQWDEPSPTLTTHCIGLGNGRFGHPEQHRAISLREAALLQSFPSDYKFFDEGTGEFVSKDIQRHIGNAVPVELARAIAKTIKLHLSSHL